MDPSTFTFLSTEDILYIQERVVARDGGLAGVRDLGLLQAAVMMPRQTFGAEYLHPDLPSMAAAYLFHIARNHPFLDGNKRAALAAAVVFVKANGARVVVDEDEAAMMTERVAAGEVSKAELVEWFHRVVRVAAEG